MYHATTSLFFGGTCFATSFARVYDTMDLLAGMCTVWAVIWEFTQTKASWLALRSPEEARYIRVLHPSDHLQG
ncbi:hypothetical protein SCLCIDRAFT_1218456 [Scleroderma citrinum Foug A]|uniref:Uncharacterized protein n=1 Tax=Scleroderma citrinum Foug A TaxID=1036808 RepID=A0A0C3DD54_9AGAM|nr:hypothetical protein SCLCIDRAFT_1218456 [Scleroderma citrinum Foug A]